MGEWINLVAAMGAGGVIAAIINAVFNRRKLSAEATEIITKAAAGTVANVVNDNTTLRARVDKLEAQVTTLLAASALHEKRERHWQHSEERYRWHLERWQRYAHSLLALLQSNNITVAEDEPSLYPDLRH